MEASSDTTASSPTCAPGTTPPAPTNQERRTVFKDQTTAQRPLAEVISEQFSQFDAQNLVVQPFEDEASRDAKFERELSEMLLRAILETHAWAAARPKYEATMESQKLEDQISHIMNTEREQGMCSPTPSFSSSFSSSSFTRLKIVEQTRAKLGEFVRRMKTALAALTDI